MSAFQSTAKIPAGSIPLYGERIIWKRALLADLPGNHVINSSARFCERSIMMRAIAVCAIMVCLLGVGILAEDNQPQGSTRLCVVWSSADPDVAKNVCFMYTLNAKKAGWFDVVHLVVWGPSAKLLAEDEAMQREVQAMQKVGVVTEACVVCARRYGIDDDLKELNIEVKAMGKPLSDRLKDDWEVITF
jgi:hypothetical protein